MYADDRTTVLDRREMLRVKANSLAEEARIIRRAERRSWGLLLNDLHKHRVVELRREARATHLALGFIKGRTLDEMETTSMWTSHTPPDWKRVRTLLRRYGAATMVRPEEFPLKFWNPTAHLVETINRPPVTLAQLNAAVARLAAPAQ